MLQANRKNTEPTLLCAMDEEEDLLPQKLMTGAMWAAAAALAASMAISIESSSSLNGVITEFKDWGAVAGGAAALVLSLVSLKDVFSPRAGSKRIPRLGVLAVLCVLAVWRLAHGLGLLV